MFLHRLVFLDALRFDVRATRWDLGQLTYNRELLFNTNVLLVATTSFLDKLAERTATVRLLSAKYVSDSAFYVEQGSWNEWSLNIDLKSHTTNGQLQKCEKFQHNKAQHPLHPSRWSLAICLIVRKVQARSMGCTDARFNLLWDTRDSEKKIKSHAIANHLKHFETALQHIFYMALCFCFLHYLNFKNRVSTLWF